MLIEYCICSIRICLNERTVLADVDRNYLRKNVSRSTTQLLRKPKTHEGTSPEENERPWMQQFVEQRPRKCIEQCLPESRLAVRAYTRS
jgi:hypothetical protein